VIGIRGQGKGSLAEFGVDYQQIELTADGEIDLPALRAAISGRTRMVCCQRSTGYGWRRAMTIEQIEQMTGAVKEINPDIICMADNCYGEFLATREPTEAGIDVLAGSLIKNPGGGLALTGGYIAGRRDLIDKISYRMTSPGIGGECGLTFGQSRTMFQGLFLAPKTVNAAVRGAVLCARVFEKLGYAVCPASTDTRSDIIEAVRLGSPEAVVAFCQGIQAAAPIDSFVTPEPWDMPGYEDQVVMAAGAFVQGSSIELSADAPDPAALQRVLSGRTDLRTLEIRRHQSAAGPARQGPAERRIRRLGAGLRPRDSARTARRTRPPRNKALAGRRVQTRLPRSRMAEAG
jgi:cystathionine beta-lyase family protein involved in aluminum resistance